jgi:uncharacterized membrane protein
MNEMVSTKSIFRSKTFWLNAAMIVVYCLTGLLDIDAVKQNPNAVLIIGMGVNFLNIIIRTFTERPVSVGGGDVRVLKEKK